MKYLFIAGISILSLMFSSNTVSAQRTVSLREFEILQNAYRNSPDPDSAGLDEGDDITHVKDVNNELNQFVGTWKGSYNNRNYEFEFVKKVDFKLFSSLNQYWDMLIGWVTVKDASGNVIYTNTSRTERLSGFIGSNFKRNSNLYLLFFTGNCYNESGNAYIIIKPDGTMGLTYANGKDVLVNDCPNGFIPVLPVSPNSVILTKQP